MEEEATGGPKSQTLVEMRAAKDAGEENNNPEREDTCGETRHDEHLGATQRSKCCPGQSFEVCCQFILEVSARVFD